MSVVQTGENSWSVHGAVYKDGSVPDGAMWKAWGAGLEFPCLIAPEWLSKEYARNEPCGHGPMTVQSPDGTEYAAGAAPDEWVALDHPEHAPGSRPWPW